ncbi:MAG: hypothetical protein U9R58_12935 [Chloroflexota bacterium]|nr:hypothetical protein [Chloroflexota bacterium]
MVSLTNVKSVWDNISELDLAPLQDEALSTLRICLIGKAGTGRASLVYQLRRDSIHPQMVTQLPVSVLGLDEADRTFDADLVIIFIDAGQSDHSQERQITQDLINAGRWVLVFINHYDEIVDSDIFEQWTAWDPQQIVYGNVDDVVTLQRSFIPAVIALLPDDLLPLARSFPLFRVAVANRLINDTCLSNAAYSFSTGLAEMVPVLGIPLTVADIFVLTKMQAFLVYKIGLALGLSTRWQDYVAEFGGVLGGGFMWRQIARSLVGLIPLYGIIPKVAISYAGTYVVGNAVLRWYLNGKHLSKHEMKVLFNEALERGKHNARRLVSRKSETGAQIERRKFRPSLIGRGRLPFRHRSTTAE